MMMIQTQGFNATLTEPVRGDQIKAMELKLHPEVKDSLRELCRDPKTTIVVLSGSDRNVLDEVLHLVPFPWFLIIFLLYTLIKVFRTEFWGV